MRSAIALLTAVAGVCSTRPAAAQDVVMLPYPWLEYCYRTRDPGCVLDTITPPELALINIEVTEAIETLANSDPLDPWTPFPADHKGDCDDDAATKRAALLGLGFDPKAMRFEMGEVIEPDGRRVAHMVLVVKLDEHEYILDRKTPGMIYTAGRRPYEWTPLPSEVRGRLIWQ